MYQHPHFFYMYYITFEHSPEPSINTNMNKAVKLLAIMYFENQSSLLCVLTPQTEPGLPKVPNGERWDSQEACAQFSIFPMTCSVSDWSHFLLLLANLLTSLCWILRLFLTKLLGLKALDFICSPLCNCHQRSLCKIS